jgi:hypothetical protein
MAHRWKTQRVEEWLGRLEVDIATNQAQPSCRVVTRSTRQANQP